MDAKFRETRFSNILGNSREQFLCNNLKVITFNFDRSFERRLFLAVQTNYPGEDVPTLVAKIPILHVRSARRRQARKSEIEDLDDCP